ncbi:TetR/AcrR family transcriptional regulator [Nocardiopsis tropica]|jgi:AcrR family transcriptional regulator|uniref:TetR family transcriptional regulator C-terminal domain-containing protein n=1 Tax=Nocardiopsis tropica TaxID=109330 RepID=A0ABU7KTQ5_9ACTN|nr:TetR family transcriptional regulator C-terminal domain-containing protein [Nocardiopsis umidischolae]MEE2052032.1 TetR family transcriptional regulator C-terminal domain-containing protein [Nocardiopsis umidischolae]
MSHTRTRAADAALTLLGTQGLHSLTHGRVDAAAGLPKGSASNHFRTRAALVRGVVDRLEEKDREIWATLYDVSLADDEHFTDALVGYVTAATTTYRDLTTARYTLALESVHNPEIRESLARGAEALHRWTVRIALDLGAADPEAATRTLTSYVDGLIMRGLTRPCVVEPRAQVLRVVRACLR